MTRKKYYETPEATVLELDLVEPLLTGSIPVIDENAGSSEPGLAPIWVDLDDI